MPATKAYPRGALVPSERNRPEKRADTDSTKISGPRDAGEARNAPATATKRTTALIPAATQTRHGRADRLRDDSPAATGPASYRSSGRIAVSS
jgi:hypothetical protein